MSLWSRRMLNQQQNVWQSLRVIYRDAPLAWSVWQRLGLYALVGLASFGLIGWLGMSAIQPDLLGAQMTHERLRAEFRAKLLRAAPLASAHRQGMRLKERLQGLEEQLPGPQEMSLLLADLSRAGRARNLRFELLRPADLNRQLPYAQQRIALRVAGRYQDLAGFAADLAGLRWLVSIQSFSLVPTKDGTLVLDASLHTLRPMNMSPTATKGSP